MNGKSNKQQQKQQHHQKRVMKQAASYTSENRQQRTRKRKAVPGKKSTARFKYWYPVTGYTCTGSGMTCDNCRKKN
jgi:hypothetical protein